LICEKRPEDDVEGRKTGDFGVDVQIEDNEKPIIQKSNTSNIEGAFTNFMSGFRLYNEEGTDLYP